MKSRRMSIDALLTCGSNRVAYSALRSLTGIGLNVAVADTSGVGMGQWSRFCRGKYLYADPFIQTDNFIEDLVRILADCGAGFLLPALEETEVLARHRHMLPDGVVLPVASYDSIRKANDKNIMASHARGLGVNVPEVIEWHGFDELEEKLKRVDYPLVVKLRRGGGARGIYYPADAGDALALCKGLTARYALDSGRMPVVQRRVSGKKWMVNCLYHEGRKIASFTQRALREKPATGGVSTLRVSQRNEMLESFAEKILGSLSWHGVAMMEFKYNEDTHEGWFIEMNPRFWAAACHAPAADMDFVKLLYISSMEGPDKACKMVRPQRLGVVSRWLMGDISLALAEAKRLRWLRALKLMLPGRVDAYDELWVDDPWASAGYLAKRVSEFLDVKKRPAEIKAWELD